MERKEKLYIILIAIVFVATAFLIWIAIQMPAYIKVYNYIAERNFTVDVCSLCSQLEKEGMWQTT